MVYRFRIGVRDLEGLSGLTQALSQLAVNTWNMVTRHYPEKVSHACFLLDTDLFEFDGMNGATRRAGVGRHRDYDWERLGEKVNGMTHISPDELDGAISRADWNSGDYNAQTNNCHHFVKWCLEAVGADFFYNDYDQMLLSLF
jgi:hypothetical protein